MDAKIERLKLKGSQSLEHSAKPRDPTRGQPCGATTPESPFSTTKWLRLRDALALACRQLDRKNAKQEICDLVIGQKILLRGGNKRALHFF
jgi:hypothetical protein